MGIHSLTDCQARVADCVDTSDSTLTEFDDSSDIAGRAFRAVYYSPFVRVPVKGALEGVGEFESGAVRATGSGYCYLKFVAEGHVREMLDFLGERPTLNELLRLPLGNYDLARLMSVKVVYRDGLWHATGVGEISADDLFSMVSIMTGEEFPSGSLGAYFQSVEDGFPAKPFAVGGNERMGDGIDLPCPDLVALKSKPFDQCRCMVHSVPVTKVLPSVAVGCVQKPGGKAGVIANAFEGKPGMCHADEATRACDKLFLELLVEDVDPGILDGVPRSAALKRLCTSSVDTDLLAFGNGYCYLSLLQKDTWWRVARLLGPNPKLTSLYRVMLHAGKFKGKRHRLLQVSAGLYHVVEDKISKGVVDGVGREMLVSILDIARKSPEARVGAWAGLSRLFWGVADDPVGYRYAAESFRHVLATDARAAVPMVPLGAGAAPGGRNYLSASAADGRVRVAFLDGLADPGVYCWYLGPGYRGIVASVNLDGGGLHEFPEEGGLCFWFTEAMVATVEVRKVASLACYVRRMPVDEFSKVNV